MHNNHFEIILCSNIEGNHYFFFRTGQWVKICLTKIKIKTLQEFSKDNWLCEYNILKNIIKEKKRLSIWSVVFKILKRNVCFSWGKNLIYLIRNVNFTIKICFMKKNQTSILPICIKQIIQHWQRKLKWYLLK